MNFDNLNIAGTTTAAFLKEHYQFLQMLQIPGGSCLGGFGNRFVYPFTHIRAYTDIAKELNVSRGTIYVRIKK